MSEFFDIATDRIKMSNFSANLGTMILTIFLTGCGYENTQEIKDFYAKKEIIDSKKRDHAVSVEEYLDVIKLADTAMNSGDVCEKDRAVKGVLIDKYDECMNIFNSKEKYLIKGINKGFDEIKREAIVNDIWGFYRNDEIKHKYDEKSQIDQVIKGGLYLRGNPIKNNILAIKYLLKGFSHDKELNKVIYREISKSFEEIDLLGYSYSWSLLDGETYKNSNIKQVASMQKLALKTKNLIDEGGFLEVERLWVSVLKDLNLKTKETD